MRTSILTRVRLVGVAAVLALVAAACGTTGDDPNDRAAADETVADDGATDDGATDEDTDEVAQHAMEVLESDFYGQGSFTEPASTGPEAQTGYRIMLVNSGAQSATGSKQVQAAREVADLLGWELTVHDGQYDPSAYQEGIRQGVAQDADVIWLYSIDCPLVQTALEEAKAAGIPVVSQEAADCSDVDPDAESYFDATLQFSEGDFIEWGEALGAAKAWWLLSRLGEDANIIEFSVPELVVTKVLSDGFNVVMEEQCPSCEVTTIEVQIAEFGPALEEKVATALLRNPDVNGLAFSYDDLTTAGGAAAIMASGRGDSLEVVAGAAFPANVELIRSDEGQDAGFVYDQRHTTWAAGDMVNRVLAGEEPAPSGAGLALIDREHGLPPEGEEWKTDVDYESVFRSVWGVS